MPKEKLYLKNPNTCNLYLTLMGQAINGMCASDPEGALSAKPMVDFADDLAVAVIRKFESRLPTDAMIEEQRRAANEGAGIVMPGSGKQDD